MGRDTSIVWAAAVVYIIGLAALIPVVFLAVDYVTGHGPRRWPNGAAGLYIYVLIPALTAGSIAYLSSTRHVCFAARWAATVVETVGGTIFLCSLPLIVFSPLGVVLAFATASAGLGLETFLVTGLWTALVLAAERGACRLSGFQGSPSESCGLGRVELGMRASGCAALCLSLAGLGRLVNGMTHLQAMPWW